MAAWQADQFAEWFTAAPLNWTIYSGWLLPVRSAGCSIAKVGIVISNNKWMRARASALDLVHRRDCKTQRSFTPRFPTRRRQIILDAKNANGRKDIASGAPRRLRNASSFLKRNEFWLWESSFAPRKHQSALTGSETFAGKFTSWYDILFKKFSFGKSPVDNLGQMSRRHDSNSNYRDTDTQ